MPDWDDAMDELIVENERLKAALAVLAMRPDASGHTHGSHLHDVGKMQEFAGRVLDGADAHEALASLGQEDEWRLGERRRRNAEG